jgi:signal transduction histidine kinase
MSALAAHEDSTQVVLQELAETAVRLAQRNEALEDFAALVAHELREPLQAALVADDVSQPLEQALDLIDALLESAQEAAPERTFASAQSHVDHAVARYRSLEIELTSDLHAALPIASTSLAVILRNLLANAAAAGARHIHVTTDASASSWWLHVDDDGVGLLLRRDMPAAVALAWVSAAASPPASAVSLS